MKKIAKEVYQLDLSKNYIVDLAGKAWEDQKVQYATGTTICNWDKFC